MDYELSDKNAFSIDYNSNNRTYTLQAKKTGTYTFKVHCSVKVGTGSNYTFKHYYQTWIINVVTSIQAESISLNVSEHEMYVGESFQLTATVLPNNTTNKSVTWSSSNTNIAIVSSTGTVTAVGEGSTYITATTADGSNRSASCLVTVKSHDASAITTVVGENCTCNPLQVLGISSASSVTSMSYTLSDNNAFTVVQNSNKTYTLTALKSGTYTFKVNITWKESGTSETKTTTVTWTINVNSPTLVTSISLNHSSYELFKGKTFSLSATVYPYNATNKSVTWSSSNSNVAKIQSTNGTSCTVLAVDAGTAYITVTSTDGSNKSASCLVTVKIDDATTNTLSVSPISMARGAYAVLPINMTNNKEVIAMQFELELPEGISAVTNDDTVVASLTSRQNGHVLSSSLLENGNYQFVAMAMPNAAFSGNDGTILNVQLKSSKDMVYGEYTVAIKNIELTIQENGQLKSIHPSNSSAKITVTNILIGDANDDGKVTVSDAAAVVNHILGRSQTVFNAEAADITGDGNISVSDAAGIVNMILVDK